MLEFFRKYQRAFFIIFTVVIVISFSFFGTYSTLSEPTYSNVPAFTAVDGSTVYRKEVEEMALFLSTDASDKTLFGGQWGPNFFNDGVLKKDIVETGIAELLLNKYKNELGSDFVSKLEKEKRFVPYTNPNAKFLSAVNVWNHFSPDINQNLATLQSASSALDPQAIQARVQLFLAEKVMSPNMLRQVLQFQQRQYNWASPDPTLDRADLALFNYHTFEDWFGGRMLKLASEFIINAAILAEKQGYVVTHEEALADLERNAQISFQQNKDSPYLGVSRLDEYTQQQLRMMGMDQTKAVKLWRQVLLFRRLFQDFGNASLVDPQLYNQFYGFAKETVEGDSYRLPVQLRIRSFRDLQKLETYLNAVSQRPQEGKELLNLPKTYLSVEEVAKQAPELVQKTYKVQLAEVDKKSLQTRVTIKDTWAWEVDDKNWETLKKEFPTLGVKDAKTRDARFVALDALDPGTRSKVDAFARAAIVDAHPEWLNDALKNAKSEEITFGLRRKGGPLPLIGFEDRQKLAKQLDAQDHFDRLTGDNQHFYVVNVLERAPQEEVIAYAVAANDGTLDAMTAALLEKAYPQVREKSPELYKQATKEWRPLNEVSDQVAQHYFAPILDAIKQDLPKEKQNESLNAESLAALRFYRHLATIRDQIQKNPNAATEWVTTTVETKPSLKEQWKLIKEEGKFERGGRSSDTESLFSLAVNGWSDVINPSTGDLLFFQLKKRGSLDTKEIVVKETLNGQKLLSADAQKVLARLLLNQWNLSLEFMNKNTSGETAFEPES